MEGPMQLAFTVGSGQNRAVHWVRVEYRSHLSSLLGRQPVIITDSEVLSGFRVNIPTAEQLPAIGIKPHTSSCDDAA